MKSFQLRTEVPVIPSKWKINHQTPTLTLGSCFAEVLGSQLSSYKFPVMNNPFGTLFNPYSIAKLLTMAMEGQRPSRELYNQTADGIWLHYDFHSSFWAKTRKELEEKLIKKMADVRAYIESSQVLIITFGTAHAYRYRKDLSMVTNCHKTPQSEFAKELLSAEQVIKQWVNLLHQLGQSKKIILTVSPVRHIKDTLALNQVSKSVLRIVTHRLSELFSNVSYFPSYEIMMDELRDYRFYEDDMIHPSTLAENYIFQSFATAYFDESSVALMREWEAIRKMMDHKPMHGHTPSYQILLENTRDRIEKLAGQLPVEKELEQVEYRLRHIM